MTATSSHARASAPALPLILPTPACGRNLSPGLAPIIELAPAAPAPTTAAGRRRLRAQLEVQRERNDATEPITLADAAALVRAAVLDLRPGLRVVMPAPGVGKTHATQGALTEAAPGIVAAPTNEKVDEVQRDLQARGAKVQRRRGVLSVLRPDGTPECRLYALAKPLEAAGGSVPALLCRTCPHQQACKARRPEGEAGGIIVTTHAMLPSVLQKVPHTGPVVIDETPELHRQTVVTAADLAALVVLYRDDWKHRTLTRPYHTLTAPLVAIAALALQHDGDPATAARAYATTAEGPAAFAAAFAQARTYRAPDAPKAAPHHLPPRPTGDPLADARALAAHASFYAPPILTATTRGARTRLHELDGPALDRVTLALRVLAALHAFAHAPDAATWTAGALSLRALTPLAGVVATHPRLTLLDATPPLAELRALRPDLEVLDPVVVPAVAPRQTITYRADMHRRALAPHRVPDWPRFVRIVQRELDALRAAGVRRVLLVTFKCIAEPLRRGGTPCDALLAAWRAEGRELDVRWYGALRGLNRWADFDGCLTIGDPWPDLGAYRAGAAALHLDADQVAHAARATTAAELEQAHGRLRDIRRETPAVHRHVGAVAPARWSTDDTVVETVARGRTPGTTAMAADELAQITQALGGQRAAATALGLPRSTLQDYLSGRRPIPPGVATVARGVAGQFPTEEEEGQRRPSPPIGNSPATPTAPRTERNHSEKRRDASHFLPTCEAPTARPLAIAPTAGRGS